MGAGTEGVHDALHAQVVMEKKPEAHSWSSRDHFRHTTYQSHESGGIDQRIGGTNQSQRGQLYQSPPDTYLLSASVKRFLGVRSAPLDVYCLDNSLTTAL